MSERLLKLSVPANNKIRLDRFLASELPEFSRSRLQSLIKTGKVIVNGKTTEKTGHQLDGAESIEVHVPAAQPVGLVPEIIPLDIVFENNDLIVINKPAGLVVHPAAGHSHGTLIHAVLAHAPEIEGVGGELRPGLVHRLDKDTSGLIVLAKNERAQRFLQGQFQKREVEKTYIALVDGLPPSPTGRIDAPIGRDPRERKRMAVVPAGKGRQAITEYKVIEKFAKHAVLELNPRTGRTHQIRVHLAFIGSPIVGDPVYGNKKSSLPIDRHFLHAFQLKILLPGEEKPREFKAVLPRELNALLVDLRASK